MNNPFIGVINGIFGDFKVWMIAILGSLTVAIIIKHGIDYQKGNTAEKQEAAAGIKKTLIMGAGIFILAWLVTYIISKFSAVA